MQSQAQKHSSIANLTLEQRVVVISAARKNGGTCSAKPGSAQRAESPRMSTPSGKPSNPIDLSAYEPRLGAARPPRNDILPGMILIHFAQPTHQSDRTSLLALSGIVSKTTEVRFGRLKKTKPRGQPAAAPDFVAMDDDKPDRYAPPPRRLARPGLERHDELTNDRDLKRLEASLHWLQREEAATRLPRATPLPHVPGLVPVDATGRRHSSEMPVDELRAPSSLEPETLAPTVATRSRRENRTLAPCRRVDWHHRGAHRVLLFGRQSGPPAPAWAAHCVV